MKYTEYKFFKCYLFYRSVHGPGLNNIIKHYTIKMRNNIKNIIGDITYIFEHAQTSV